VNLLGGVDDGSGHWAPGYWTDALHPNDRGHAELARTLVPSLFDALAAGKALPTRQASAGLTLVNTAATPAKTVRLVPEDFVHPFTTALRFRTAAAGQLLELRDSAGVASGTLRVSAAGVVIYQSAKGRTITGTVPVRNNRWHKLVLTHYYARGTTMLYVDSVREGIMAERLRLTRLDLGGAAAPGRAQYRDWLFYRAGMNQGEVLALAADSLLKSSLEVYAPLDARRVVAPDSLANLAQSTNTLAAQFSLYPNPTGGEVWLVSATPLGDAPVLLYDLAGRVVLQTRLQNGRLRLPGLPAGIYSLTLLVQGEVIRRRLDYLPR